MFFSGNNLKNNCKQKYLIIYWYYKYITENNGEITMKTTKNVFYYSRKKLGLYLLGNFTLLVLAALFTALIFPDYPVIYYFALATCVLSLFCSVYVFLFPQPVAVVSEQGIKIDRANPIAWQQIKKVNKKSFKNFAWAKEILQIETVKLPKYKYNLMQKLCMHSKFGAFSIPLYAMNDNDARDIERLVSARLNKKSSEKKKSSPKAKTKATNKTKAKGVVKNLKKKAA